LDTTTPRKPDEHPDLEAQQRLFGAALVGAEPFGIDPDEDFQTYVCYEALRRLFNAGRTGRSAVTVIMQDATWSGTSRAPKRSKLNKALRALQRAAADVITELSPETRLTHARALGVTVNANETRGTAQVPLVASASLPLAA